VRPRARASGVDGEGGGGVRVGGGDGGGGGGGGLPAAPGAGTPWVEALAGACLLNVLMGTLYLFSHLAAPLSVALGAGRGPVSACFSLATTTFTLTSSLGMIRFADAPLGRLAGAALLLGGAGLVGAGASGSLLGLQLCFGVLFGMANGIGHGTAIRIGASDLFTGRKGTATGVLMAARAGGPIVLGPLAHVAVQRFGPLAVLQSLGASFFLALPLVVGLLRVSGLDGIQGGRSPGGPAPGASGAASDWTRLRARSGRVARVGACLGLGSVCGLMTFGHAASIVADRGGSEALVASCVALMAATNFCGRLAGGVLIDRLSSRQALTAFPLFAAAGMALGLACPASPAAAVGMLLGVMLTFGLITPGIAVALSRQVGADLFARAYGVIFLAWGLAGLTAPWLAGLLFDLSGGYDTALLLGLASAATAAAVGWTVPPDPPAGTTAPDDSAQ